MTWLEEKIFICNNQTSKTSLQIYKLGVGTKIERTKAHNLPLPIEWSAKKGDQYPFGLWQQSCYQCLHKPTYDQE